MADDASSPSPAPQGGRRVLWPGGLSARLLLATALVVVLANALIVPALLANREQEWLRDKVAVGELVSFIVETAPGGKVADQLTGKILNSAGVVSVAIIQADGVRRVVIAAPRVPRTPYLIDLRAQDPLSFLAGPLETLFGGTGRMVRVVDRARYRSGEVVEVLAPDAPLRASLLANLGELIIGALFTSVMAGALVYLLLHLFLVR